MDRRWQITAWYLIALIATITITKLLSARLSERSFPETLKWFLFTPSLSTRPTSRARAFEKRDVWHVLTRALLFLPATIAVYSWLPDLISQRQFPRTLRGYLAAIPIWLITETTSLITQLCFLPAKILLPPIHKQPWRSRTLAEFWGQRWNRLFSDWFRQVCFRPLRRIPSLGLLTAFAFSGVMHEFLVNVPLWIVFRTNLFGSMCLYFLIQAGGILVERQILRQNVISNRVFAWFLIIGPLPLVLNEGTLRIFQLLR